MTSTGCGAPEITSRGWFGKASAALVLGFTLALALTCTFRTLFSAGDPFFNAQGQIAMWLMAPAWGATLSLCFLFRSGLRAWGWLAGMNALAWALYALARLLTV